MESLENMLDELNTSDAPEEQGASNPTPEGPLVLDITGVETPEKKTGLNPKKKKIIVLAVLLLLLLAAAIGFTVWWMNRPQMDSTTAYWFDKYAEDGTLEGKTQQELQGMLNQIVEGGMVNVSMNAVVVFEDGSSEGSLGIENIEANQYYVRVVLTNDADGSVLYESGGIKPGQYIDKITLNQDLPKGEYQCTATEIITDPETMEDIGQVNVAVRVIVAN